MKNFILILISSILFYCCKKDHASLTTTRVDVINFEKHEWVNAIDSLKDEYFQGAYSSGTNVFVNLWKGENGMGPVKDPSALISFDNGNSFKQIPYGNNGLPKTWTYFQQHKNSIYAGSADSGLYKLIDNGLTWQHTTNNNLKFPDVIYSNNDKLIASDRSLGQTYISDDDGLSWRLIYSSHLTGFLIYQSSILSMYRGNIIESNDWGATWSVDSSIMKQIGKPNANYRGLVIVDSSIIAANDFGVFIKKYHSKDAWQKISTQITNEIVRFFWVDGKLLVQDLDWNNNVSTLYYSSDFGRTWKSYNQGVIRGRFFDFAKSGKYLFAAGEYGFYKRQIED